MGVCIVHGSTDVGISHSWQSVKINIHDKVESNNVLIHIGNINQGKVNLNYELSIVIHYQNPVDVFWEIGIYKLDWNRRFFGQEVSSLNLKKNEITWDKDKEIKSTTTTNTTKVKKL